MPDRFDEHAAIAGEAAGLRPEQWPGLAHLLRNTAAAEREAIAQQVVAYSQCHADCDHRGVMDPETGDWPCTRKAGCWCDDIAEHGDELALEIRNRSNI